MWSRLPTCKNGSAPTMRCGALTSTFRRVAGLVSAVLPGPANPPHPLRRRAWKPINQGRCASATINWGKSRAEDTAARLQTGMVFQNFNLFPAFGVRSTIARWHCDGCAKVSRGGAEHSAPLPQARPCAELAGRFPRQLSGGQQQRSDPPAHFAWSQN